MHDAVGDQFGPVVIPADGASRRMDGGRGQLFQLEDGHGGPANMVSEAIKHTACEVNEPLSFLASNRVLNMKLDFACLIATFRIVFLSIATTI
jgi:hypothetical protein